MTPSCRSCSSTPWTMMIAFVISEIFRYFSWGCKSSTSDSHTRLRRLDTLCKAPSGQSNAEEAEVEIAKPWDCSCIASWMMKFTMRKASVFASSWSGSSDRVSKCSSVYNWLRMVSSLVEMEIVSKAAPHRNETITSNYGNSRCAYEDKMQNHH